MKNLTKEEATNLLAAWSAIEVLTPQSSSNTKNFIGKDRSSVISFNKESLPWEVGRENSKTKANSLYQVVIGTIDLKKAQDMLLEKFGNNNGIENSELSGESIISLVIVNQDGYPVDVDLSSFAWGVSHVLKGNLKTLSDWSWSEQFLREKFRGQICKKDEAGNPLPITKSKIDEANRYLVDLFSIPEKLVIDRQFAVRVNAPVSKGQNSTRNIQSLINSFYLPDLTYAKFLINNDKASENLQKYLGMKVPEKRYNILGDHSYKLLENIVAPKNTPVARWPGPGRHPLVLLQQAAVNISQSELKQGGILGINGPPGTGKTTLLRDIFASVITERAKALSKFEDPATAFTDTKLEIKTKDRWLNLYSIDESLKGFEIIIASATNKAVENISTELPSVTAIASDINELQYFSTLADELLRTKSWGLVSAALGNSTNCSHFSQKFWWNNDFGLATYLAEASGIPQVIDVKDPKTGKVTKTRTPRVILENNPPRSRGEALKRWQEARENFINALNNCQKKLNELENIREDIHSFENLANELGIGNKKLEELILEHKNNIPSLIARIFRFPSALKWKEKQARLLDGDTLEKKLSLSLQKLGTHVINKDFFLENHVDKNLTSPWCDSAVQILRDKVFIEAIKLSKAFIDVAAKPLLHNLGILMRNFGNQVNQSGDPNSVPLNLQPDLWTSLFLVVPSVSTTLASVSKMFGNLPQNSLGWLIIDEAGQVMPQAVVGAIVRMKHAVITGDPLQIEPVMTLPKVLTESICREFNVDHNRFIAPKASVQTLADSATPYFAEFCNKHGNRTVGFPLLVHRRCSEPMFSIANVIAYDRLMVQAKKQQVSSIRDCLGHSAWFDVTGQARGKWCQEEGEKVIELLRKLKGGQIFPDLFVITPFRMVANNLYELVKSSGVMRSWPGVNPDNWGDENIGTLHTVQGREADTVILVLGAPAQDQTRSRIWASQPNMLNVAVTRAKENLYVIGNKELWKEVGVFKELHNRI
ncbi:MAG: hypothetical protein Tsb006_0810 [Rickettsiaceae bacterium]